MKKRYFLILTMLLAPNNGWAGITPFDGRLEQAGFNESVRKVVNPSTSVESLFSIARSFRYVPDSPRDDNWQTAEETDARQSGDCEDKALWLYRELKRNGYENVQLVVGKYRPSDTAMHAWVFYTDETGKNIILDPTTQRKPWKAEDFSKNFYRPFFSYNDLTPGGRSILTSA